MAELKPVYKIRNQAGLFSTGTMEPTWTRNGKCWTSKGALHSHLVQVGLDRDRKDGNAKNILAVYNGCAIIVYVPNGMEPCY